MNFRQVYLLMFVTCLAYVWTGQAETTLPRIIVAQDGSGHYLSITSAIKKAPLHSNLRYYIEIKQGTYHENIIIDKNMTNIVFIGEGVDKTIITGNRSNGTSWRTYDTATVVIKGDGFFAQGITFENTAKPEMRQAVALMVKANYSTFYRCNFRGYQDTLYTKLGSQFFRDCEIQGAIDFICGNSRVIFQNCIIHALKPLLPNQSNTITAQSRNYKEDRTGIIFQNCTVIATSELSKDSQLKSYLGRAWRKFSRTVYMQSFIDGFIDPEGWVKWHMNDEPYFAEYDNKGPGGNTLGRVKWSRVIKDPLEASQFTVRNFLEGGLWIPSIVPHYLDLL